MRKIFLGLAIAAIASTGAIAADQHTGGLDGYSVGTQAQDLSKLEHVTQKLVVPPAVPEHSLTAPDAPRVVQVEMTIQEKEIEVEPGVFMWAFTFNGSVPGPLIVVHEGDYVELTLKNPSSNQLVHNIDFHASTGALGGGELTHVAPGEETVLRWKATKPGIFVYHCAPGGAMIPWHVVHGMNGAIVVLPKDGLKDKDGNPLTYDKAFYIGEQDYYIPKDENGKYKRYNSPAESFADDKKVMDGLIPTHVIFGESKGQLTGDNAMQANVGDTIMLYHSQANRPSYPHLIGGHGEYVWERGNLADTPAQNLESWVIGAGSAGAAMYTFKQPGTYVYLSHNLIEAVNLGAISQIRVDGEWNNDLMEQVVPPSPIKDAAEVKDGALAEKTDDSYVGEENIESGAAQEEAQAK
ncbi:nitrite reductase, copper-containing [Cardiobacteriaceae bacterium TAE3-ERU3]|nr:nitrite reductase, copper-containing [Cardiobacteriaceae bacterium TAE3-ERU3]